MDVKTFSLFIHGTIFNNVFYFRKNVGKWHTHTYYKHKLK